MEPELFENPRMPLTKRGVLYLFVLVGCAMLAAYLVITAVGILDPNVQYAITISLIVFFIGTFFCRDNVWIGLGKRLLWSCVIAIFVLFVLLGIDSFFKNFFSA